MVAEEAEEGGCVDVGEPGVAGAPTAPAVFDGVPFLGACCRRS